MGAWLLLVVVFLICRPAPVQNQSRLMFILKLKVIGFSKLKLNWSLILCVCACHSYYTVNLSKWIMFQFLWNSARRIIEKIYSAGKIYSLLFSSRNFIKTETLWFRGFQYTPLWSELWPYSKVAFQKLTHRTNL